MFVSLLCNAMWYYDRHFCLEFEITGTHRGITLLSLSVTFMCDSKHNPIVHYFRRPGSKRFYIPSHLKFQDHDSYRYNTQDNHAAPLFEKWTVTKFIQTPKQTTLLCLSHNNSYCQQQGPKQQSAGLGNGFEWKCVLNRQYCSKVDVGLA